VTKKELNLLKFTAGVVTEPGAAAAKVMRREMRDAHSRRVSSYGRPDDARRDFNILQKPSFGSAVEHLSLRHMCV
jgi:hypothetical protein